ncbi:AraC family transcriptional regulator [Kiritimatiellota bacterium B12222]|nr:AraC family transcriptional regulator [Kiritimatiellota bacterium B12222]
MVIPNKLNEREGPSKTPEQWDFLSKRLLWIYRTKSGGNFHNISRPGCQSAILVLKGYFEVTIKGKTVRTEKNEWLITPHCSTRIQSAPDGYAFLSVGWEAKWPTHHPLLDEGLPMVLPRKEGAELEEATENLYRAVHGSLQPVSWTTAIIQPHESLEQLLEEEVAFAKWFLALLQVLKIRGVLPHLPPELDDRTMDILACLRHHPVTENIQPKVIEQRIGLSWRRIHDLFKKNMGMTPHEYLNQRRLEEVSKRLLSGLEPPKAIAYSMGFNHLSHFSAWFKKYYGVSPRQYILEHENA